MAYKRYVYKKGKKFGPYFYESYRDKNGIVRKRYVGTKDPDERKFLNKSKKLVVPTELLLIFGFLILGLFFVIGFSGGLTGFVVSEESAEQVFDGEVVDLEIKEPAKLLGARVSENKNKRMEFEIAGSDESEGTRIRLYFDLLNYSEFVEGVAEVVSKIAENETFIIINESVSEVEETDINVSEEEIEVNMTKVESNVTVPENVIDSVVNETIGDITEEIEEDINVSEEVVSNVTEDGGVVSEVDGNESDISEEAEVKEAEEIEDEIEEEQEEIEEEGESEEVEEEIVEEESAEPGITGNIVRFVFGFFRAFIQESEISGKVVVNVGEVEGVIGSVDFEEIKEKVGNLSESELEDIEEKAEIELGEREFDVVIDEEESKALNKSSDSGVDYKWGYEVELKDLKFFAKIEVSGDEDIVIYDDSSLRIGRNLLSFVDLVDSGYNVSFNIPELVSEVSVNVSEEVAEVNVSEEIAHPPTQEVVSNVSSDEQDVSEEVVSNVSDNNTSNIQNNEMSRGVDSEVGVEQANESSQEAQELEDNKKEKGEKENKKDKNTDNLLQDGLSQGSGDDTGSGLDNKESNKKEKDKHEKVKKDKGITGNFVKGITGLVVGNESEIQEIVEDIEYENKIVVYIERDFTGTDYSVGDVIYLDPKLIIIPISDAEHLDSNRSFLSNIYNETVEQDDVWSEVINESEFVRASFVEALDNSKDVSVYARVVGVCSGDILNKSIMIREIEVPCEIYEKKKRIDEIQRVLFNLWNSLSIQFISLVMLKELNIRRLLG